MNSSELHAHGAHRVNSHTTMVQNRNIIFKRTFRSHFYFILLLLRKIIVNSKKNLKKTMIRLYYFIFFEEYAAQLLI